MQVPKKHRKPAPSSRPSTSRRAVVTLAAAVLLVVGATAYSQLNPAAPTRSEVSALAVKATDAVGTTLVKGISAVTDRAGLGRLVPADAPAVAPPAPANIPATRKSVNVRTRPAETGSLPEPFRVFDLDDTPIVYAAAVVVAEPTGGAAALAAVEAGVEADETIYSAVDATVSAPIGIRPQLPRVLPDHVQKDQLGQMELVILPDGTVASVKLLGSRQGVLEGMLLSAAKTWTFVPAMKAGRPVTYRKSVWLALR
jgi:hypothetical protein